VRSLYFTDLHINDYKAFSGTHDRLENCLQVLDHVFAFSNKNRIETILFGGDMFDTPKILATKVLLETTKRFNTLFQEFPKIKFYAISGNHDMFEKNHIDIPTQSAIHILEYTFPENFFIIDNRIAHLSDNVAVFGIPFYEFPQMLDIAIDIQVDRAKLLPKNVRKTLLLHNTPAEVMNINADFDHNDERLKIFDVVLCGHIHLKKVYSDHFILGGNPLHRDLNDMNDDKGFWFFNLEAPAFSRKFISRKGRYPEFHKVYNNEVPTELKEKHFVVQIIQAEDVVSTTQEADPELFSTFLSPEKIIENYYIQERNDDPELLTIGLSLVSMKNNK
jgi:DNA repair exonuclease SbcCD nuclease subunit